MSRILLVCRLVLGVVLLAILTLGMKLGLEYWNESERDRLAASVQMPPDIFGGDAPRRRNGTFDFAGALNERMSDGVTKENNAAIPLLRIVLWEDKQPVALRDATLRALRVTEKEAPSIKTVTLGQFLLSRNAWDLRTTVPGSGYFGPQLPEKYHQLIHDWVDLQQPVLDIVAEAARKSQFALPFVNWDDEQPLRLQQLSLVPHLTELSCVSASVEMERGNVRSALDRVLDGHHLTRLMLRDPTRIQVTSGLWDESEFLRMEELLIRSGRLSEEDCTHFLLRLQQLPVTPRVWEVLDVGYRVWLVDEFLGYQVLRLPAYSGDVFAPYSVRLPRSFTDIPNMVTFHSPPPQLENPNENLAALMDMMTQFVNAMKRDELVLLREINPLDLNLKDLPEIASTWCRPIAMHCDTARDRMVANDIRLQLIKLCLHVEVFRHQSGRLPHHLGELSSEDVSTLLVDPYGDGPIRYRSQEGLYRVYSVGRNGPDEEVPNYGIFAGTSLK